MARKMVLSQYNKSGHDDHQFIYIAHFNGVISNQGYINFQQRRLTMLASVAKTYLRPPRVAL